MRIIGTPYRVDFTRERPGRLALRGGRATPWPWTEVRLPLSLGSVVWSRTRPDLRRELECAARELVGHVGRMLDDWAELSHVPDQRNRQLWRPLHDHADRVGQLLDQREARR